MTGRTGPTERVEVAVVGGGPAGALIAAHVARAGRRVVLIERAPTYRWRAGGVFASPAAVARLQRAGLDAPMLARVARPVDAMVVEAPGGATVRLTYGAEAGGPPTVGFDRSALDPALLDLARAAGAELRLGTTVDRVDLEAGASVVETRAGDLRRRLSAQIIVGADGHTSLVATAAAVLARPALGDRIGLTYHVPEPSPGSTRDGRMVVLAGAYCGVAPVPGGRLNVGIVLASEGWRRTLRERGAHAVARDIVASLPRRADDGWRAAEPLDAVEGAAPLGVRVRRRSGPGWLLVGDAAGFLDPFTGEGLHRAFVSAELGAAAVLACLRGDSLALDRYDRSMRARFRSKDVVSLIVQGFLGMPSAFDYAAWRLARRPSERETLGLVMGDLVPASSALDPRFLLRLLAP